MFLSFIKLNNCYQNSIVDIILASREYGITIRTLTMLRHLSAEKQTQYGILALESTSPILSKPATKCMVHKYQELLLPHPGKRSVKCYLLTSRVLPPASALISQEIKPTYHCPEAGS